MRVLLFVIVVIKTASRSHGFVTTANYQWKPSLSFILPLSKNDNNVSQLWDSNKSVSGAQQQSKIPSDIDVLASKLASMSRFFKGVQVDANAITNNNNNDDDNGSDSKVRNLPRLIEYYDIENSRDCRRVRERITELNLIVDRVIPAAPNSRVFTDPKFEYSLPEGSRLPRLVVQENGRHGTERVFRGANEIITYLERTFLKEPPKNNNDINDNSSHNQHHQSFPLGATGKSTLQFASKLFQGATSIAASTLRSNRGTMVAPSTSSSSSSSSTTAAPTITKRPKKPLILYSYEGNQFCRLVREVLFELDIIYELRTVGKNSNRRKELIGLTNGINQCPFLIDPNEKTKNGQSVTLLDSAEIVRYLYKTYSDWVDPMEGTTIKLLQSQAPNIDPSLPSLPSSTPALEPVTKAATSTKEEVVTTTTKVAVKEVPQVKQKKKIDDQPPKAIQSSSLSSPSSSSPSPLPPSPPKTTTEQEMSTDALNQILEALDVVLETSTIGKKSSDKVSKESSKALSEVLAALDQVVDTASSPSSSEKGDQKPNEDNIKDAEIASLQSQASVEVFKEDNIMKEFVENTNTEILVTDMGLKETESPKDKKVVSDKDSDKNQLEPVHEINVQKNLNKKEAEKKDVVQKEKPSDTAKEKILEAGVSLGDQTTATTPQEKMDEEEPNIDIKGYAYEPADALLEVQKPEDGDDVIEVLRDNAEKSKVEAVNKTNEDKIKIANQDKVQEMSKDTDDAKVGISASKSQLERLDIAVAEQSKKPTKGFDTGVVNVTRTMPMTDVTANKMINATSKESEADTLKSSARSEKQNPKFFSQPMEEETNVKHMDKMTNATKEFKANPLESPVASEKKNPQISLPKKEEAIVKHVNEMINATSKESKVIPLEPPLASEKQKPQISLPKKESANVKIVSEVTNITSKESKANPLESPAIADEQKLRNTSLEKEEANIKTDKKAPGQSILDQNSIVETEKKNETLLLETKEAKDPKTNIEKLENVSKKFERAALTFDKVAPTTSNNEPALGVFVPNQTDKRPPEGQKNIPQDVIKARKDASNKVVKNFPESKEKKSGSKTFESGQNAKKGTTEKASPKQGNLLMQNIEKVFVDEKKQTKEAADPTLGRTNELVAREEEIDWDNTKGDSQKETIDLESDLYYVLGHLNPVEKLKSQRSNLLFQNETKNVIEEPKPDPTPKPDKVAFIPRNNLLVTEEEKQYFESKKKKAGTIPNQSKNVVKSNTKSMTSVDQATTEPTLSTTKESTSTKKDELEHDDSLDNALVALKQMFDGTSSSPDEGEQNNTVDLEPSDALDQVIGNLEHVVERLENLAYNDPRKDETED